MELLHTSSAGKLYEKNGFLVPVLSGTSEETGFQYGVLMREQMQKAWDVLLAPAIEADVISDDDFQIWATCAYTTCSTRNRLWYKGVAEGAGWPLPNVCMLDHAIEFGAFQSTHHSFASCTSFFLGVGIPAMALTSLQWSPGLVCIVLLQL